MADVEFRAALDMGDVAAALATLPAMTGKEAKKAVALMDKSFQKAAREAAKLGKAQRDAAREADRANKDLAEGLKGVAELAGISGDKFEKLSKVLDGLSNPLSAMGVSAGAALVGVAGLAAGIVGVVQASQELATKLEPYREIAAFQGLDQGSIDSIHAANDAMDSMVVAGEAAVVLLGGQFADTVGAAATGLLTLQLAALDVVSGLDGIGDSGVFQAFVALNPLASATAAAFQVAAVGLEDYREEADELILSVKEQREEQDKEKESTDRGTRAKAAAAQARREAAAAAQEEASALSALAGITASAHASMLDGEDLLLFKRDEQIAKIDEMAAELGRSAEVQTAADTARLEVMKATDQAIREMRAQTAAAEAAAEEARDAHRQRLHDAEMKRIADEEEAAMQASQDKLATAANLIGAINDMSQLATDKYIEGQGEQSEAAKKAAMRQWKLSKALNMAMAVVNTAQGVLASVAALGPPVWPNVLGMAGAATAVAMGAASGVAIASAPAPSFHTGGMIGHGGPSQPDERMIRARTGEAVLNSGAANALGEAGVNALNRGEMGAQRIVVVQQYKHRVLDAQVQDLARIPGSSLRTALKRGDRVGHRTR